MAQHMLTESEETPLPHGWYWEEGFSVWFAQKQEGEVSGSWNASTASNGRDSEGGERECAMVAALRLARTQAMPTPGAVVLGHVVVGEDRSCVGWRRAPGWLYICARTHQAESQKPSFTDRKIPNPVRPYAVIRVS